MRRNIYKAVLLGVFTALIFLSCSDNLKRFDLDDTTLLPKLLVTEASYNAEPWFDYTYTTTVKYDEMKRPLLIEARTDRVHYKTKKEDLVSLVETTFAYPDELTIQVIKITERLTPNPDEEELIRSTDIYNYAITSSGDQIFISQRKNGEENETIIVDTQERTISLEGYYALAHLGGKQSFSKFYRYDKNENIIGDKSVNGDYMVEHRYKSDKYNGIYKNVNLPIWYLVTQFDGLQDPFEHLFNNIREASSSVRGHGFSGYYTNEYEYNQQGYPVKKRMIPDPDLLGLWGNTMTIEYQSIK